MSKYFFLFLTLVSFLSCNKTTSTTSEIKSEEEKLSYVLGQEIGASLKETKTEINSSAFLKGFEDSLQNKESMVSEEETLKIKMSFNEKIQTQKMEMLKEEAEKNEIAGKDFLAKNKNESGVIETSSGLQYKILEEGSGPKPTAESVVTVHYTGTLIDGSTFDSSRKRNQPATFPLTGVIKGWSEGLQLMSVGTKFQLFVPSQLAYGVRGSPPVIGPNATLIFDVELLEIKK